MPYMVAFKNLNGAEDPAMMDTWLSLGAVGDAYGLLTSLMVIYVLHWNWSLSLFINSLLFLVSSITESCLAEVEIENQPTSLSEVGS